MSSFENPRRWLSKKNHKLLFKQTSKNCTDIYRISITDIFFHFLFFWPREQRTESGIRSWNHSYTPCRALKILVTVTSIIQLLLDLCYPRLLKCLNQVSTYCNVNEPFMYPEHFG